LECILSFQEVTKAVQELSIGKSPGLDGLPSEFFKQSWGIIGKDYYFPYKLEFYLLAAEEQFCLCYQKSHFA